MDNTDEMVPYDSSMRLDFLAGRPIEVESIYGNALRAAESANVQSPIMRVMYQQLKFLADQRPNLQEHRDSIGFPFQSPT